jgi:hypothetical protein
MSTSANPPAKRVDGACTVALFTLVFAVALARPARGEDLPEFISLQPMNAGTQATGATEMGHLNRLMTIPLASGEQIAVYTHTGINPLLGRNTHPSVNTRTDLVGVLAKGATRLAFFIPAWALVKLRGMSAAQLEKLVKGDSHGDYLAPFVLYPANKGRAVATVGDIHDVTTTTDATNAVITAALLPDAEVSGIEEARARMRATPPGELVDAVRFAEDYSRALQSVAPTVAAKGIGAQVRADVRSRMRVSLAREVALERQAAIEQSTENFVVDVSQFEPGDGTYVIGSVQKSVNRYAGAQGYKTISDLFPANEGTPDMWFQNDATAAKKVMGDGWWMLDIGAAPGITEEISAKGQGLGPYVMQEYELFRPYGKRVVVRSTDQWNGRWQNSEVHPGPRPKALDNGRAYATQGR